MNTQNHIKDKFININPIHFYIPDMMIIWLLYPLLDEQTNTISHQNFYIYTWCELKKDHVTNHDSPNSWRHRWNLGHAHSCLKFPQFFANKMIHDCIGDHMTYKIQSRFNKFMTSQLKFRSCSFLSKFPHFFANKMIHDCIDENRQHIKYIIGVFLCRKKNLWDIFLDLKIYFIIFPLAIVAKCVTSPVFIEIV